MLGCAGTHNVITIGRAPEYLMGVADNDLSVMFTWFQKGRGVPMASSNRLLREGGDNAENKYTSNPTFDMHTYSERVNPISEEKFRGGIAASLLARQNCKQKPWNP